MPLGVARVVRQGEDVTLVGWGQQVREGGGAGGGWSEEGGEGADGLLKIQAGGGEDWGSKTVGTV